MVTATVPKKPMKIGNAVSGVRRKNQPAHTSPHGISQFTFETDELTTLKQELIENGIPITWEFENDELGYARLLEFVKNFNAQE